MKTCSKCKTEKPLTQFGRDKNRSDGLRYACKVCIGLIYKTGHARAVNRIAGAKYRKTEKAKQTIAIYRNSEQEKARRRDYNKSPNGRKSQWERTERYRNKYPSKPLAHRAIRNAVRAGKLPDIKSLRCSQCIAQADIYHHWAGYEKAHWFDIIPVCNKYDRKEHRRMAS